MSIVTSQDFPNCTICLEPILENLPLEKDPITGASVENFEKKPEKLLCGHVFHKGCITAALKEDQRCPLDRGQLQGLPTKISVELSNKQRLVVPLDGISCDSTVRELIERINEISPYTIKYIMRLQLRSIPGAYGSISTSVMLSSNRTLLQSGITPGSVTELRELSFT